MPTKGTTEQRGYGNEHRKRRAALLAAHVDGTPCARCDQPMYLSQDLDADHSLSIKHGGTAADRLAHRSCNRAHGGRIGHQVNECPHHKACGSYHSRDW